MAFSDTKTISVTLSPDLLTKAQELAQREHCTIGDLLCEALQYYMHNDPEWEALLARTRDKGHQLGITSEADVERLSDEYRRARR